MCLLNDHAYQESSGLGGCCLGRRCSGVLFIWPFLPVHLGSFWIPHWRIFQLYRSSSFTTILTPQQIMFHTLAAQSKWNEPAFKVIFWEGLSPTLVQYITAGICLDNLICNHSPRSQALLDQLTLELPEPMQIGQCYLCVSLYNMVILPTMCQPYQIPGQASTSLPPGWGTTIPLPHAPSPWELRWCTTKPLEADSSRTRPYPSPFRLDFFTPGKQFCLSVPPQPTNSS